MTFGTLIKERRIQLGMNQEDLATAVGTTKATVSRWESGEIKNVKRPMVFALAKALDLDPSCLICREVLWPEEHEMLEAYRAADRSTRQAVRRALGIFDAEKKSSPELEKSII